ncbi:MAG: hypothetical protein JST49_04305 [Bacteroidetes bacterium]|nr:hypothetical protein [Bacteroidota bacterium]
MSFFDRFFCGNNVGKLAMVAVLLFADINLKAQTNAEKFGQNRVQYKDYKFQYYESDNFTTYFYQGGQDIGKYVIKTAEDVSDEISALLDFKYRRTIDIIVYNNINELNQTNIGIYEANQVPGGTVKIPANKIFIYFNGDHRHIDKQLREQITRIYINNLFKGVGFSEAIQNSVMVTMPDWYRFGLMKYVSEPWSSDMEDRLRDGIMSGRYKKLNRLQPEEAIFVGHSIWHYIEEVHGKSVASNIIYLSRVNRSVDNGFLFVLGTNLSQTLQNWYTYYYNRFNNEKGYTAMPPDASLVKIRTRKGHSYYQPCISPDGKYVAYAGNDMGRYKVYLTNTETKKTKVIFRGGYKTNTQFTDESIPLLSWDPSGKRLAIISDKRAQIFLRLYDVESKKMEVNPMRKFQKVISFNFVDSKQLVMSATQNGQTDIYLYTIASTTTRKITDDYHDDLYPAYVTLGSSRGIMFSSNRPDENMVPGRYESQSILKQHDLYYFDLDQTGNQLIRITNTPMVSETYPQDFGESEFSYLSDETGIRNRYVGHLESTFDHNEKLYRILNKETEEVDSVYVKENVELDSIMDMRNMQVLGVETVKMYKTTGISSSYTNYGYSIRSQTVSPEKGLTLDWFVKDNKPKLYKYEVASTADSKAPTTEYMVNEQRRVITEEKPTNTVVTEPKVASTSSNQSVGVDSAWLAKGQRPYDFQSEFDYGIKLFDWDSAAAQRIEDAQEGYVFRFSRVRPYFIRLMVDRTVVQLDNNLLMTRYQPFDPANPNFDNVPLGFMLKVGVTDLLENHKIYAGMRIPFSGIGSNNEFFVTYENLTKRLDTKFTFYRKSIGETAYTRLPFTNEVIPGNIDGVEYSIKTNYAELEVRYPFDVLSRLNFGLAFRNDRVVYKAKDDYTLNLPSLSQNWLFLRAEYVFDNCIEIATNIRYGTRFKVFGEIHKEFPTKNKQLGENYEFPLVQFNNKYMTVFGADLRHYMKVYKQIIWANRIAIGASFGNKRMIYYMGGLDNWLTGPRYDKFDRTTPINLNNNYAFQTLATPLRGFKQNARNGDKFLLINSELRVPIFAALINSPIKAEFIRNFQLVAFMDVGTAWEGASPFSDSNPLYNEEIPNADNPSVVVRVKRYKTPVIMGFGPGVRTTIFGFFLRLDAAWGVDTGEITKRPMYYFTFGLDF